MSASMGRSVLQGLSLLRRCHASKVDRKHYRITSNICQQPNIRCLCSQTEVANSEYTEYEKSTEEFKYVERLLPKLVVPTPSVHTEYPTPSGWYPSKDSAKDLPYYIHRTKNHMLPVYLKSINNLHMTIIKKVDGDIWNFETDLRKFLEAKTEKKILTQVHELRRAVLIKGVHIPEVAEFLKEQGF